MKEKTKRIALAGMLTALAMIFSYIEAVIPFSVGIAGVKLGLANLVVLSGLYVLPARDVFTVSITRILLSSLLFGNLMALAYSLAGGVVSFFVMFFLVKHQVLSPVGVSTAGGIAHNTAQILVAYAVLQSAGIFFYLPVLLISGILAGIVVGAVSRRLIPVWKNILKGR